MKKTLLVLLFLFLSNNAQATDFSKCKEVKKAVKDCVTKTNQVNKRSYSKFDAFVNKCNDKDEKFSINTYGSPKDEFEFDKCMAEAGIPLDDTK